MPYIMFPALIPKTEQFRTGIEDSIELNTMTTNVKECGVIKEKDSHMQSFETV